MFHFFDIIASVKNEVYISSVMIFLMDLVTTIASSLTALLNQNHSTSFSESVFSSSPQSGAYKKV